MHAAIKTTASAAIARKAISDLGFNVDAKTQIVLAALEKFEPEGATASEWERACKEDGVTRETFYRRREKLEKAGTVEKEGEGQGARYRPAKSEPVSVSG